MRPVADEVKLGAPMSCPSCGYVSDDIRCPRCNALKIKGCAGACLTCASSCPVTAGPAAR
jgi:hypothetical protein